MARNRMEDDFFDEFIDSELSLMTGSENELPSKASSAKEEDSFSKGSQEELSIERDRSFMDEDDLMIEEFMEDDSSLPGFLEQVEIEVEDPNDFTAVYEEEEEFEEGDNLLDGLSPVMRAAIEWKPPEPKSDEENLVNEWITTGWVGNLHIDLILTEGIITGASDVHITADQKVSMTRNGDIIRYGDGGYKIPDDETMNMLIHNGILNMQQQAQLNRDFEYSGAYTLMYGPMAGRRTRLTIGRTFGKYFMVFRIISDRIPSLEDLEVEEEMVNWSKYPNGLFLLCGPTGSGKSTTLASILRNLQMTTKKKIISIENPVEYIYPDDGPSLVVQRDVGEDTRGFYEGLTSAMRQSPNAILLGEVRNTEEVTELLRAAETGHLAISTMHTNSVPTTINRIQNLFDGNEQLRVMSTLADTLRGIGNQVLVKTKDGGGRFAVRELLTVNDEIKDMIIKGDIREIRNYQIEREATMEHKLARAVQEGRCHYEDAFDHVSNPDLFKKLLNVK